MESAMNWETVKLDGKGPVRHLVLNRPQVHNAVNQQLLADLLSACAAIEALPDCRCVIVRGEGPSFSSGADLKEGLSRGGSTKEALHRSHLGARVIDALGTPKLKHFLPQAHFCCREKRTRLSISSLYSGLSGGRTHFL